MASCLVGSLPGASLVASLTTSATAPRPLLLRPPSPTLHPNPSVVCYFSSAFSGWGLFASFSLRGVWFFSENKQKACGKLCHPVRKMLRSWIMMDSVWNEIRGLCKINNTLSLKFSWWASVRATYFCSILAWFLLNFRFNIVFLCF
jgi:hypothetical protein